MKAFLLAAGHGTRLKPITDRVPKCLVPICGEPLLKIWLDICASFGIDEVLVNVHAHADVVRGYVRECEQPVRVRVAEEEILLGSAGTLRRHRAWVESEPLFWVFYADVLNCVDLRRMLEHHSAKGMAATIGVYRVPDPSRCGVVTVDDAGIVRGFVEKPARPTSNLVFSGILLGGPELLAAIPDSDPVDIGSHVLPRLVNRMAAYEIEEYLRDVGTMSNYEAAQMDWPAQAKVMVGR
ncbi:MAG: nucleotidyltransferase family protein [Terriglobales bacterium]